MLNKLIESFLSLDAKQLRYPGFVKSNRAQIKEGYENVKAGKGWRSPNKKCPLCTNKRQEILFTRFNLNYIMCNQCNCAYVDRFPVDTSDIYNNFNYKSIAKKAYLDNSNYRIKRFATERINLIKNYISVNNKKVKLLDIGCGTGWFLEYAKTIGYDVQGYEFSKELAQLTSKRLNIKIFSNKIDEIDHHIQYDVITMFDVIEHVLDPLYLIKSAYKILKKDGIILFYTPNLESLAIHHLREFSSAIIPVHHPILFSKNSLERLCNKVNLNTVFFETKGTDLIDIFAHYDQLKKNKEISKFILNNADVLQAITDKSLCGNHMRLIVKKK